MTSNYDFRKFFYQIGMNLNYIFIQISTTLNYEM